MENKDRKKYLAEFIGTFALVFCGTGAAVVAFILFAGPISGGSFNPARSLAPAIISGNLTALWIYLTAPI